MGTTKYKEFKALNLPEAEKETLARWEAENTFEKSVSLRNGAPQFVFYEGPPSANGMPGIHHVISRTLKDLVCRYKTMQGFQVRRKGGWDTHGLPIELGVEKELGITKEDIGKKISVEEYNQKCREAVLRFKDKWDGLTKQMGYWVDLNDPYITFNNSYIETLWWLLKQLYNKGLLYESVSIQPYSPAAGTGLSSHELNQPGTYKDVKDTSAVAMFELINYENRLIALKNLDKKDFISIPAEQANDLKTFREETKRWAYDNLRKQKFIYPAFSEPVVITRKGIDEILAFSPVAEEVLILKHTEKVLADSVLLHSENSAGSDGAVFHYMVAKILIGKNSYLLKTVLKKTDKLALYDMRLMPIKKSWQSFAAHLSKRDDENLSGLYKDKRLASIIKIPSFIFQLRDKGVTDNISLLTWTTTPWTLPSNLGLTVGAGIDYCLVKTINPYNHKIIHIVLAEKLLSKYFQPQNENIGFGEYKNDGKNLPYQILMHCKGSDMEGLQYKQLLPFSANKVSVIQDITHGAEPFRVLLGDFVTTEDGTGIVHTAPAFGADDFRVGKKYNIGILTMVDKRGRFLPGIKDDIFLYGDEYIKEDYLKDDEKEAEFKKQKQILEANRKVKDLKKYLSVDDRIVLKLQEEGKLFKKEKYDHTYPHCWRTDKPILYYPLDAWFIRTSALKDKMVELNKTINWKPKSTGEGRFGNWLENMVDWNLSRSRFWGTPLPIWKTEDGEEEKCIGTIEELMNEIEKAKAAGISGSTVNGQRSTLDLHKPYVDEIILVSDTGKPMKRVPDLIDVWFDSGAMPYAQWGLDYEKLKAGDPMPFGAGWEGSYPADFIAEGVDQTRGWFYTLHAIASLIYESVAYKTVVSNGLVLDKNGNKMSKRLGNVVDPFKTIAAYGADATRWYLITNASPWDNLKFDIDGIKEVQRKFFGTLYNTYQFFVLYANVDAFTFSEEYIPADKRPEIDRWILSSLHTVIKKVTTAFDEYEPTAAGRLVEEFVDEHLSNWYVRLSRRRFWKGEYEHDKICAYQTLYECLETVLLLMAPVSPFFSDELFRNLTTVTGRHKAASVHHANYPVAVESLIDAELEERMQLAQDASSLVLSLRKKAAIKVRQPLQKILIPVLDSSMKDHLVRVENLILSEVNVKEVEYLEETEGFIRKKIKANFKTLGAKLGGSMKEAAEAISNFTQHQIAELEKNGIMDLPLSAIHYSLSISDVEITAEDIPGWSVASKGALTVALDITVTDELKQEGDAREFINRVQNIRKDNRFDLTDRVYVDVLDSTEMKNSIDKYKNYICAEILADSLNWVPQMQGGTEIEVNDVLLKVSVTKKG